MRKTVLLFMGSIVAIHTFAQTPKDIEQALLKAYKCISATSESGNNVFAKKLKNYTIKYPATLNYPFNSLIKEHLDISSSNDGLFRIYSWDTQTGGTMHFLKTFFNIRLERIHSPY